MFSPQTLKDALKQTPACLSADELCKHLEDDSLKDSHLAECPRCQGELAMLRAFQSDTPIPDEGGAVDWMSRELARRLSAAPPPFSWRAMWTRNAHSGFRFAVPAMAALTLVLAVVLLRAPKAPLLQSDSADNSAVMRSGEITLVAPLRSVEEVPSRFIWKPVPGAVTYDITLKEVDQNTVWEAQTRETQVAIPAAIRDMIVPHKPFVWRVTALSQQKQELAASQSEQFMLSGRSSPNLIPH